MLANRPRLKLLAQSALVVGALMVVWLVLGTVRTWLYYQSIGREPYRSNAFRIAGKEMWSTLADPFYDARLRADGILPRYALELTDRRVGEWNAMVDKVYARGYAIPEDQVLLPARLRFRDREWGVEVRGRGTLYTHYRRDKPSWRVRLPGDEYIRGNRVLNLVIPYDQARVNIDPTLNAVARQYGLTTYPTRFVTLELNGEMLGVYQEIEHFREELAVQQYRSEGFFMSGLGELKGGAAVEGNPRLKLAAEAVAGCVKADPSSGPDQHCDAATLRQVLDRYLDPDKLAFYAALTSLFGASHAWGEDNLILFFDPPRGRFEPIPWDMGSLWLTWNEADPASGLETIKSLGDKLMRLPDFRARRNHYLMDLLRRKQPFAEREATRQYAALRPALDFDTEHTRRYARRMVDGFDQGIEKNYASWTRYFERTRLELFDDGAAIEIRNYEPAPVYIEGLALEDPRMKVSVSIPVGQEVVGGYKGEPGRLRVEVPPIARKHQFALKEPVGRQLFTGRALAAGDWRIAAPASSVLPSPPLTADSLGVENAAPPLPQIRVENGPDGVTWVYGGNIALKETLVQPEGVHTRFEPGLTVDLAPGIQWVLRGDLISIGTAEAPILIRNADPAHPWLSFIVLGRSHRKAKAVVEHTIWQGGLEGTWRSAYFTGMVSFYDAWVSMRRSIIRDVRGEDGLNVKFGMVDLRDNIIEGTASDAVDLDFCTGTVVNNIVRNTLGDGIDFSGSLVRAEGNRLEKLADKGLSIGENTTVLALNNVFDHPNTGTAVKDRSWAEIRDDRVIGAAIGLSSYRKKPVFSTGGIALLACRQEEGIQTRFLYSHNAWIVEESCPAPAAGAP